MLTELTPDERLRLICFVCSFAWADLEIAESEREMIRGMVKGMELSEAEAEQVEQWLEVPPSPEDLDPQSIPQEHRQLFLNYALQMVGADGRIDPEEMENLSLLEQLLR